MSSNSKFVWGWLYSDENIIYDNVIGKSYDRDVITFVKLHYDLKYEEFIHVLYRKLSISPNLYKLSVSGRFPNLETKTFEVVFRARNSFVSYTVSCTFVFRLHECQIQTRLVQDLFHFVFMYLHFVYVLCRVSCNF